MINESTQILKENCKISLFHVAKYAECLRYNIASQSLGGEIKVQNHVLFYVLSFELSVFRQEVFQHGKLLSTKLVIRGGVEDTRLEAKAKDTKKIRGQG